MKRSHNGQSHNIDKTVPVQEMKLCLSSEQKNVAKKRHKKKRRFLENRIIKEQLES